MSEELGYEVDDEGYEILPVKEPHEPECDRCGDRGCDWCLQIIR